MAHKSEGASPDLLVVGAYPRGQHPDMCSPGERERKRAADNVAAVPLPARDPVGGDKGPLPGRWARSERS